MDLPKYVLIGGTSQMIKGDCNYTTRGWELPLTNVKEIDGRFYVKSFMKHLDGRELIPITKEEYEADQQWNNK